MKIPTLAHWLLPLLLLVLCTLLLDTLSGDIWLADRLFILQGNTWALKQHWLLENLIHKGGRNLVAVLLLCSLYLRFSTKALVKLRVDKTGLSCLLIAVITSLILVSSLKGITHIPCPWGLQRYGGAQLYNAIFSLNSPPTTGRCFPAGHASGGYAWVAIYFYAAYYHPQWKYYTLAASLLLGATFGLAQQLRGAHFLSHDLWTLAICWYTALSVFSYNAWLYTTTLVERVNWH